MVGAMKTVHDCLEAATRLAERGIDAEVIDLRTLRPMDTGLVLESVSKTSRLVVVEEGPRTGGWAAEVLARISEQALDRLDDVWRITTADTPIPYSPTLEDAFLPSPNTIVDSIVTHAKPM